MQLETVLILSADLALTGFLLYLSILDFRKHRIRDLHTFGVLLPLSVVRIAFLIASAVRNGISVPSLLADHLIGGAAAFGIFYGTAWALYRMEEKRTGQAGSPGIGGGDIKLISVLGLSGGLSGLIVTVLAGFLIGIPVSLLNRSRGKRYTALAGFFSLGFLLFLILSDWIPVFL